MKSGCCVGCQPTVSLDEAGCQPTLQRSTSPKPYSVTHPILMEAGYAAFNHGKSDDNFVWNQAATYSKLRVKGQTDSWDVRSGNRVQRSAGGDIHTHQIRKS